MKNKRTINIKNGKTETNTFKKTVQVTNTYKNVNPRLNYPKGNVGPECKQCNEDTMIMIETQMAKTTWDISLNEGCDLISEDVGFGKSSKYGFIVDYVTEYSTSSHICVSFFIDIYNNNIPHSSSKLIIKNNHIDIKDIQVLTQSSYTKTGAPFRAPIAGYRRSLICEDNSCNIIKPTNTVYGDSLSNAEPGFRYNKQIRSGMQPKKNDSCKNNNSCKKNDSCKNNNSCKNNTREKAYSFSYAEYNKNRSLNTYERGLEHNKRSDGKYIKSTGSACDISCCNTTVWKPNNEPFKVQGAVSSSSRIDRLKLETLRVANSKCDKPCDNNNVGKGKYFAGKPRFDGWMFNRNHREIVKKTIYK